MARSCNRSCVRSPDTGIYAGTREFSKRQKPNHGQNRSVWRHVAVTAVSEKFKACGLRKKVCDSAFLGTACCRLHAARDTLTFATHFCSSCPSTSSSLAGLDGRLDVATSRTCVAYKLSACTTSADLHPRSPSSSGSEALPPETPIAFDEGTRTSKIRQPQPQPQLQQQPPRMGKLHQLPLPLPLPHRRRALAVPWLAVAAR